MWTSFVAKLVGLKVLGPYIVIASALAATAGASIAIYQQVAPKDDPASHFQAGGIPPGPYGPNNNPFVTRSYNGVDPLPPPDSTTY